MNTDIAHACATRRDTWQRQTTNAVINDALNAYAADLKAARTAAERVEATRVVEARLRGIG